MVKFDCPRVIHLTQLSFIFGVALNRLVTLRELKVS